jgi:hypothetical protein
MVKGKLNIFLSASIPLPDRNPKYIGTADVIAIRDSVIALASTVLPHYNLIFGGHPSITALIAHVLTHSEIDVNRHVKLYQSGYFVKEFPEENKYMPHKVITKNLGDKKISLAEMRRSMIEDNEYEAAFFIGGMEGVEEEFQTFVKAHPKTKVFPIASTGAAAKIIYDRHPDLFDARLLNDLAFASLFKDLLNIKD